MSKKSTIVRDLLFSPIPTYLGVKLEISLTFCHHLMAVQKKVLLHVTLLRQLAGSGWGAGAKTLCTADLSLCCSTAEYCTPVWHCSTHTCLIDSVLNDVLCIVHWMPASHSNGPLTHTLRHSVS